MNASALETNSASPGMAPAARGSFFDSIATEVLLLQQDLRSLDNHKRELDQQLTAIESIWARCRSIAESSTQSLIPPARTTPLADRQIAGQLQSLLESLSGGFLRLLPETTIGSGKSPNSRKRILNGILDTTAQRILLASLTSSRTAKGLWRQLHQTYLSTREDTSPQDNPAIHEFSPDAVYLSAVLLGYSISAGFSPAEIAFLHSYFRLCSSAIEISGQGRPPDPSCFWISPESDMPARSCSRTPPPPESAVLYFSGTALAESIQQQLSQLETGTPAGELKLPDFANTPEGKNVLRRTVTILGTHLKRRFPRRRQNYRGEMCFGIENVCQINSALPKHPSSSCWMITNESPDGYAAMHISGKSTTILAGDVAALRIDGTENWQLCMIRWKHSANPEHLELGLQILATRIFPARVVAPLSSNEKPLQEAALFLPATPSVHEHDALVLPSGTPVNLDNTLILIVERDNISVREIRIVQRDEQTAKIEVFRIGSA